MFDPESKYLPWLLEISGGLNALDVTLPQGSSIETTSASVKKLEDWLHNQPEAAIVTSYTGGGAARFFLAYNPELPNPNFAKLVISTPNAQAQERLLTKLRQSLAAGLVQEARVRASRFVFGPYSPWPVAFRVSGPDLARVRAIADQVLAKMRTDPHTRQANEDWGERAPTMHFVLDQDRLHLMGLTPSEAGEQIQFLLTGVPVIMTTIVRGLAAATCCTSCACWLGRSRLG